MSDCNRFNEILDSMLDGNISEEDRSFLNSHAEICEECSRELAFVSNIEKTLHTMPKLEVPDDFMSSLNKKLDLEEKIKKNSFNIKNKKVFSGWKKYSALTACLLLAVLAKVDVFDVSSPDNIDEPVVEYSVIEKEDAPEVNVLPDVVAEDTTYTIPHKAEQKEVKVPTKVTPAAKTETKRDAVSSADLDLQSNQMPVPQITINEYNVVSVPSEPVLETPVEKPVVSEDVSKTETVQEPKNKPTKVVVIDAGTPHSSVEPPAYVNDPDVEVVYSQPVENNVVKLHDLASVSDEAIEKAFGITDLPDNKVIIATPTAMEATVKAAEQINNSANMVSINTHGAGNIYVSYTDKEKACKILDRYLNLSEDNTLSDEVYSEFLTELENSGIRYKKYIVNKDTVIS